MPCTRRFRACLAVVTLTLGLTLSPGAHAEAQVQAQFDGGRVSITSTEPITSYQVLTCAGAGPVQRVTGPERRSLALGPYKQPMAGVFVTSGATTASFGSAAVRCPSRGTAPMVVPANIPVVPIAERTTPQAEPATGLEALDPDPTGIPTYVLGFVLTAALAATAFLLTRLRTTRAHTRATRARVR